MTFGAYPLGGAPLGGQQGQGEPTGTSLVGGCGIMGGTMLNECPFTAATMDGLITRLSGRLLKPKVGSFQLEHELGGRRSCRLTLDNPGFTPSEDEPLDVRWCNDLLFAGTLHQVDDTIEPSHALRTYQLEALGWEYLLEHRIVTATYENQAAGPIFDDVVARYLVSEGILRGTFQAGPTLVLARADQISVAQFMRDVAEGAGGIMLVDPGKLLSFYKDAFPAAPFTLDDASIETIANTSDREDYRNKVTIRVRGTGGTTIEVTRDDPAQIALRQASGGGSGIYERFESIEHPTSNDPLQLQRLGIGYALIRLQLAGQRTLRARTRRHHLQIGQALPVNLPASGLAGTWVIQRLRIFETDGERLQYELEAVQSNTANVALEGLLRIVQAGRATVQLPGSLFATLVTISTSGTFIVPGTGTVELEISVFGPGGGGASSSNNEAFPGMSGGPGGKAVSFRAYPAGTALNITIGAGGLGGVYVGFPGLVDGAAGGMTKVDRSGELVGQAESGGGADWIFDGQQLFCQPGASGAATGDITTTGGGAPGGAGGVPIGASGQNGANGRVEIRF